MIKKLSVIFISIFLLAFNANAGSDGELKLDKKPKKVKDCFENLNRATFAFNQKLDKAIIKPLAESYRDLPVLLSEFGKNISGQSLAVDGNVETL